MMTRFSLLSFLPMKKIGDAIGDAPSLMRPRAFSCLIQFCSRSPSAFEHGYGLHLIDVGAFGRNLIVMLGSRFGGKRLESSSEKTLQCCRNSIRIVSIVICVRLLSSVRLHSWARLVRLRKATSFSGSCPVLFNVASARLKKPLRYLNFVLCNEIAPPLSCPATQSICGLNSRRNGYPRIILSFPRAVKKNFCNFCRPL